MVLEVGRSPRQDVAVHLHPVMEAEGVQLTAPFHRKCAIVIRGGALMTNHSCKPHLLVPLQWQLNSNVSFWGDIQTTLLRSEGQTVSVICLRSRRKYVLVKPRPPDIHCKPALTGERSAVCCWDIQLLSCFPWNAHLERKWNVCYIWFSLRSL